MATAKKIIVRNRVMPESVVARNISTTIQREMLRFLEAHGGTVITLSNATLIADTVAKKIAAEMFSPAE